MSAASLIPRFRQSPREDGFVQDPYPAYARMRAAGPAVWWEDYELPCLTRFEAVNAALRDRRLGREILHVATRETLGWDPVPARLAPFYAFERRSLLEREPPAHTRLRALVNRAFVSRAVETARPKIRALAHRLIDAIEADGGGDLLRRFCEPIPVIVIAELLGTPVEAAGQMRAWSNDMVAMHQARRDRAIEDRAVAATLAFSDFMRRHVEERRRRPGEDLLTSLIAAEADGARLSTEELIATAILLMNAGHEATVHALGNGLKAVLERGEARRAEAAALFAERETGERAAEELVRLDPPLHLFTRYALEDLEIAGVRLRQGEQIGLLLGSANRDPARFSEPDVLRLDRAEGGHAGFGAGVHFCVGAPLARAEIREALDVLLTRLPRLRLAAPPRTADRYHFHGLEALEAAW